MTHDEYSAAAMKRYQRIYDRVANPFSPQALRESVQHMRKCGTAAAEFQATIIENLLVRRDAS